MLVRRLLASLILNQKRRIISSPSASVFVSPSSSTSSTKKLKRHSIKANLRGPAVLLQRILQQSLQFLLFGHGKNNVTLASTSLNRAVKYSGLEMTSTRPEEASPEAQQELRSHEGESASSQPIEDLDEPDALDELRASYADARKTATSCWLDYSNKSCHIYLHRGGGEPSESMAAFDLDGTLIRPKSNKRIPRSATDWDFFSVWTKIKLQQCLRDSKARFVIFTNQNGIGLNIVPLEEVQKRIELVTKRLDVPCTVFMAVEKDAFRKPQTGMFKLFNSSFNDSIQLDHKSSFYCGDAIGYPSHSDADIKFAQKLALPFLTPEKFVRGVKPKLVV